MIMKAISIRQPWAWLILHGGKDVENRVWPTNVRGRVLIHAAKEMRHEDYNMAVLFTDFRVDKDSFIPPFEKLERGGIVGSVEIVDCCREHHSPWFEGPYGFVLRNPEVLPFKPCRGLLGFFSVV
jgi:hypothetical protein